MSASGDPVRVVVVGADAAGMSAAHQLLRTARAREVAVEIVALESTRHTSYSACGLPYWVAGDVESGDDLVARDPEAHRAAGIDLRTGVTGVGVDLLRRVVRARDAAGVESELPYDELVLATGAEPRVPDWARAADGTLVPGVLPLKTLDDGARWRHLLDAALADGRPPRAAVVGAGYIGVEMAEALLRRGCHVALHAADRLLPGFEEPVRERMRATLEAAGVEVVEGSRVEGLEVDGTGAVRAISSGRARTEVDLVVLATGVVPRTDLEVVGGTLPRGASDAWEPDDTGRLAPHVWTAGDCSTVAHRLLGRRVFLPLGTHANKQGRVVGTNVVPAADGGTARFGGALGTAITRFSVGEHHLEVSRTGLGEDEARDAGFTPVSLLTEGTTISGYLPAARPAAIWVVADAVTRRLLGVQIAGGEGAAKRIDTAAATLWLGASVDDVAGMDLSYAPPFATTWDVLQIAVRRLADRL